MNLNFRLAILVSILNVASKSRLEYLEIAYCNLYLRILHILYLNGVIGGFSVKKDKIVVKFKYKLGLPVFNTLKIISKPGNRVMWSLAELNLKNNHNNISGFYILSTSKGLITDAECLLKYKVSGEVLILVRI